MEVLIEDFAAIHEVLQESGFLLFDMRQFSYTTVDTLASFDALYIAARHRALLRQSAFDPAISGQLVAAHEDSRRAVRERIAESLERCRAGRWPDLPGGS